MLKRLPFSGLMFFMALACLSHVDAAPITLRATGAISTSSLSSAPVGSPFIAYLSYDPEIEPFSSAADNANYAAPAPLRVEVGASTLIGLNNPAGWQIFIANDLQFVPGIWFVATGEDGVVWVDSVTASGPIASDPLFGSFNGMQIGFLTANNTLLTSTILPSPFPGLGQWDSGFLMFFGDLTGSGGAMSGSITSLEQVPEPGTVALLGIGACVLFMRQKLNNLAGRARTL